MNRFIWSLNGLTTLVGLVGLALFIFAPWWLGWPAMVVAAVALGRLLMVGNRRHKEVWEALDLDNRERTGSRLQEITELLKDDDVR